MKNDALNHFKEEMNKRGLFRKIQVCANLIPPPPGADGEALRDRHTGCSHLSQTSALAAQNVLHGDLVAAKGIVAFAEVVQILFAHACLPPK